MMVKVCKINLAWTSLGQTRSELSVKTQSRSVKCAMGSLITLRIGSVNVGTMRGGYGETVEVAAKRHLDFCCFREPGRARVPEKWVDISSFGWAVRKVFIKWGCWWLINELKKCWL